MPEKHNNVLSWASVLEPEALLMAERTGRLSFVDGHVALMPDAHVGIGSTVGSVIPTRGAIIPSAVGVDIGCGMIAAELPFTSDVLGDDLQKLHSHIAQAVPSGVGKRHTASISVDTKHFPGPPHNGFDTTKQGDTAYHQFGTLGAGNHFVEVCLDERDLVWVVLHSGSRGIGNQLARFHIAKAKDLMKEMFIKLEDPDLAYFVQSTDDFQWYVDDMLWAQRYALGNREAMLDAVLKQVAGHVGHDFKVTTRVNCHHNYTELENHHGKNLWITRKGAIRAREGDLGVIPGSMGAASYIVRGLGNPSSYHSAAHGAGRRMSRKAAKRELDLETFEQSMAGIAWNGAPGTRPGNAQSLLDEDPRSYKDIGQVMADQQDLVSVEHTLSQVLNYKGT